MTYYYLMGYSKETGKRVYKSALTDDLKELLLTRNRIQKDFGFILTLKRF